MRFNIKMNPTMMKTIVNSILVFSLGAVSVSFAQSRGGDERRADNNDLRSRQLVFSVEAQKEKYTLESSGSGEFSLSRHQGKKLVKVWKVDKDLAMKLDENFADQFIKLKYEMEAFAKKSCSMAFDLNMRGEEQQVCEGEDDKKTIIEKIITDIKNKFS